jgi:hypothetical protein
MNEAEERRDPSMKTIIAGLLAAAAVAAAAPAFAQVVTVADGVPRTDTPPHTCLGVARQVKGLEDVGQLIRQIKCVNDPDVAVVTFTDLMWEKPLAEIDHFKHLLEGVFRFAGYSIEIDTR